MIGITLQVALGGAIGAALRFWAGAWAASMGRAELAGVPIAVLSVNIVGSFAMGVLAVALARGGQTVWQPFLMTGVLGGFTTFSAFSLEAVDLMERGAWGAAGVYVVACTLMSIAALALGMTIARGVGA